MNYCTLFNSYYLSRGLALYQSLIDHAKDFHLIIFAFDQVTADILQHLQLAHVTVISLPEFETNELLAVKSSRTIGEYCWTCTPATILHCLEKLNLPSVCYLDADLFFYADPQVLIDEVKDNSILITEHRYTPVYDNSKLSGKYCVQFMFFKNDERGLHALRWWNNACVEWCFDRVEPGRFGDQKYLDDWTTRFAGVHVLNHLGGGLAPWNIQQYKIHAKTATTMQMIEKKSKQSFTAIFYHFHAVKFVNQWVDFGSYQLSAAIKREFYLPYVRALLNIEQQLNQNPVMARLLKQTNLHAKVTKEYSLTDYLRDFKKRLYGIHNKLPLSRTA